MSERRIAKIGGSRRRRDEFSGGWAMKLIVPATRGPFVGR